MAFWSRHNPSEVAITSLVPTLPTMIAEVSEQTTNSRKATIHEPIIDEYNEYTPLLKGQKGISVVTNAIATARGGDEEQCVSPGSPLPDKQQAQSEISRNIGGVISILLLGTYPKLCLGSFSPEQNP